MLRLLLLSVCVSGCHWTLNESEQNTLPQTQQLYFPAGLAVDPAGQFLYVANGNSDLRFGGGTVQMIDVNRFECAVSQFCVDHGNCAPRSVSVDTSCTTSVAD